MRRGPELGPTARRVWGELSVPSINVQAYRHKVSGLGMERHLSVRAVRCGDPQLCQGPRYRRLVWPLITHVRDLVRLTLALTRGPRRARALSADLITRLRPRASKARDRPDRRVERVVMGRGCQHDHNLHASPRVSPPATNNADRCAVEGHRTSPDPGAPRAWQPTREACRHPGHRA